MITKETREIDFIFSNVSHEFHDADEYSQWKWNLSDHKPLEIRM